jgi:hypothetical protein
MFRAKNRNAKIAMLLIDRTNRRNSGTPRRKMIAQIWTVVEEPATRKKTPEEGPQMLPEAEPLDMETGRSISLVKISTGYTEDAGATRRTSETFMPVEVRRTEPE